MSSGFSTEEFLPLPVKSLAGKGTVFKGGEIEGKRGKGKGKTKGRRWNGKWRIRIPESGIWILLFHDSLTFDPSTSRRTWGRLSSTGLG